MKVAQHIQSLAGVGRFHHIMAVKPKNFSKGSSADIVIVDEQNHMTQKVSLRQKHKRMPFAPVSQSKWHTGMLFIAYRRKFAERKLPELNIRLQASPSEAYLGAFFCASEGPLGPWGLFGAPLERSSGSLQPIQAMQPDSKIATEIILIFFIFFLLSV